MSALPEYTDDLSEAAAAAASFVMTLQSTIKEQNKLGEEEMRRKVADLYTDEILNEVVARLNRLFEPMIEEGIRKQVTRAMRSARESEHE